MYRAAALEAAQRYTGLWVVGRRWVKEILKAPSRRDRFRPVRSRLPWYPTDGVVYISGPNYQNGAMSVDPRSHGINLQPLAHPEGFYNCCDPCSKFLTEPDAASYYTGFKTCSGIPTGIALGAIRYIAYQIANPGDIDNSLDGAGKVSTRMAANNAIVASGAAAEWDLYRSGLVVR